MSRPPRERRHPALLRSRFRVLIFAGLAAAALALGEPPASIAAAAGLLAGILSLAMARTMGPRLAHTFVVLDWLLLGCVLAMSGGIHSWLLAGVPLLTAAYLAVSPKHQVPYLIVPCLVLLIVLSIADPTLGGSKVIGVGLIVLLVAGGTVGGIRLSPDGRKAARVPRLDPATGFYNAARLPQIVAVRLEVAAAGGEPVSLAYFRLQNFRDTTVLLGPTGTTTLVRGVAARIREELKHEDVAFRLPPDAFAVLLPGREAAVARQVADRIAHVASSRPIAGRRQSLAIGVAAFPTTRSVGELLAVAKAEAQPVVPSAQPTVQPVPVAVGQ